MPDDHVIRSPDSTLTSAPYWPRPVERYPGRLPERADVLVIGGGIAGTGLMHHLRARRMDAVLVERAHIAAGASGRNAGFLLAGVADSYAEAVLSYGRSRAREIWGMTLVNHATMIEAVAGQPVGHRRLGSAILASGEEEAASLAESAQRLNEVLVRANGAECRAGCVILATNAYTPLLLAQVEIQPRRAQMLASAPDAAGLCDLPTYSHFGYRYWRQLPTGEVLIGGWRDTAYEAEVGYDERPTDTIQAHLDAQLKRIGAEAKVTHRWAGTMGFTESGLPLVGPVDGMPNVYLCAGFNGQG